MFHMPYDVTAPTDQRLTLFRFALPTFSLNHLITLFVILFLSACVTVEQEPVVVEPPIAPEPVIVPTHSSEPIVPANIKDVRFAQQALTKIGYKIGPVDGLWGPRSAGAIRAFESKLELSSANGHLSELNLHELEVASGISRDDFGKLPINKPTLGINAKLDKKTPLSEGPQLIIVDHEYKVLSKPNPYSSELLTLATGTGIYVISKQDGYFEVESINRKRGYIKAD